MSSKRKHNHKINEEYRKKQKDKNISLAILFLSLLTVLIFALFVFLGYKNQKFMFAPYVRPDPPANTFFPLGNITYYTQEEIDEREKLVNQYYPTE